MHEPKPSTALLLAAAICAADLPPGRLPPLSSNASGSVDSSKVVQNGGSQSVASPFFGAAPLSYGATPAPPAPRPSHLNHEDAALLQKLTEFPARLTFTPMEKGTPERLRSEAKVVPALGLLFELDPEFRVQLLTRYQFAQVDARWSSDPLTKDPNSQELQADLVREDRRSGQFYVLRLSNLESSTQAELAAVIYSRLKPLLLSQDRVGELKLSPLSSAEDRSKAIENLRVKVMHQTKAEMDLLLSRLQAKESQLGASSATRPGLGQSARVSSVSLKPELERAKAMFDRAIHNDGQGK